MELTRRNIPFSITSGLRFFEQAHVKDVAAYLRLLCNPRDELAFKRVVRLLPGIGGRTAERLWKAFDGAVGAEAPRVARALQACAPTVPARGKAACAQLVATLSQLEAAAGHRRPGELLRLLLEADYEDHLKAAYVNYRSRQDDLQQLALFADGFASVAEFLAQVALLTNVEAEAGKESRRDEECLRLSTVHQAKGLEFDVVFVIMLCDGLFPSARSLEMADGEEEERRLFYVAVTRAKDGLYLSYPLMRAGRQGDGAMLQQPSRFLAEVPAALREEWTLHSLGPTAGIAGW
jgi:DNA helicase-2/ATP-dependent DNA helicase PcrA